MMAISEIGGGILALALLGGAGLLVVATWLAILDRYRAASKDVLGIQCRD